MSNPFRNRPDLPPLKSLASVDEYVEELAQEGYVTQSLLGKREVRTETRQANLSCGPDERLPEIWLSPADFDFVHSIVWQVIRVNVSTYIGATSIVHGPHPVTHPNLHHPTHLYQCARLFGFQVFNISSSKTEWTPATAFVAADHLCSLLRDGILRRRLHYMATDQPSMAAYLSDSSSTAPFSRLLAESLVCLHSSIFHPYETHYCPLVGLRPRLSQLSDLMVILVKNLPEDCAPFILPFFTPTGTRQDQQPRRGAGPASGAQPLFPHLH